jgi:hypothetical protein
MKANGWILGLMLLCAAATGPAWADGRGHRHHHHHGSRVGVGVYFGVPLGYHWYGPPSYYYRYPQTVIVQPEPVYIERAAPQAAAPAEAVWYYCSASRTYYPYVKDCPGGWERVVPTPPPN